MTPKRIVRTLLRGVPAGSMVGRAPGGRGSGPAQLITNAALGAGITGGIPTSGSTPAGVPAPSAVGQVLGTTDGVNPSWTFLSLLTQVGTLTSGVWNATKIALGFGGTGADLSATGGAHQVLKQSSAGAAITVGQLDFSDLASTISTHLIAGTNITLTGTDPVTINASGGGSGDALPFWDFAEPIQGPPGSGPAGSGPAGGLAYELTQDICVTPDWGQKGQVWGSRGPGVPAGYLNFATLTQTGPNLATASTTFVMGGAAWSFTPTASGKVLVHIQAVCLSNTANDGAQYEICYGTGTAPSAGAALTGTVAGQIAGGGSYPSGEQDSAIAVAVITGLTPGTTYWFDFAGRAVAGGTGTIANTAIIIVELP